MARDRNDLASCAVCINGEYLEDLVQGYATLRVKGREALTKLLEYNDYRTDGGLFDYSKFPVRDISVEYFLGADTPEAFRESCNQLMNLLNQDEADIQFNDEFDKFYVGGLSVDTEEPIMTDARFVHGTYTIRCFSPFKYTTAVMTAIPTYDGNTASFAINYRGSYPARPVLQAEFAGALEGGSSSEDGDCGYVAFMDEDRNIIQLGNPDAVDLDQASKAETLINRTFESDVAPFTLSGGAAINQSITDTYWNNGSGQTLKYIRKASSSADSTLSYTNADGLQNFSLSLVQRLATQATDRGSFYVYLKDANDSTVCGFLVNKGANGTTGTVSYIVNGTTRKTENIDLSLNNTHYGYATRTAVYKQVGTKYYYNKKTKKWSTKQAKKKKDRGKTKIVYKSVFSNYSYSQANLNTSMSKQKTTFTFKLGKLSQQTFEDASLENAVIKTIVIGFTGNLHTNAIYSCVYKRLQGKVFAETPNIFTAGDVVTADCNDGSVYIRRAGTEEGQYAPEYGALGNDWEPFVLSSGMNNIQCVWSSWVDEDYKPTVKIIYNEVFI